MKKLLLILCIIAGGLSVSLIYSCKKSDNSTTNSNNNGGTTPTYSVANDNTFNDDANYYKSENDQVNTDVNNDVTNYPSMQGRKAAGSDRFQSYNPPCGSTVDTTYLTSQHKLIYTFDGTTNCWGRHRSGSITVQ